jgi:hypothetical protein
MIDRLERQIGIGLAAALGSNSADAVSRSAATAACVSSTPSRRRRNWPC